MVMPDTVGDGSGCDCCVGCGDGNSGGDSDVCCFWGMLLVLA